MKIAVIGAGLSGSSLAWHLIHQDPSLFITLFDPLDPKERTSSLAHLLYPYVGMKSKLSWMGELSFEKAKEMLQTVQSQSKSSFYAKRSLLKMPSNSTQLHDFEKAASNYTDLKMVLDPFFKKPALWVKEALQVESSLYLEALTSSCTKKGVKYVKALFKKSDQDRFDLILHASGEKAKALFKPNKSSVLKGQALIIQGNPTNLKHPIIYDGLHLIPSLDQIRSMLEIPLSENLIPQSHAKKKRLKFFGKSSLSFVLKLLKMTF